MYDFAEYFQTYDANVYRVVEGQYFLSTRKLVNSDDEQDILESIIEEAKPIAPKRNSKGSLHKLLYTPFRYPPLKSGGRFHKRFEQSIFYASETLLTAMSEVAYKRFVFISDTDAKLSSMEVPYTHFMAHVRSEKSLLLTEGPFVELKSQISDPTSYNYSQDIGSAMRVQGVELFSYFSSRYQNGVNVGLFSAEAFAKNSPLYGKDRQWMLFVQDDVIEFKSSDKTHAFRLQDFSINIA